MNRANCARSLGSAIEWHEHYEVERFVYLEAQLADESRYDEWEALLDEEMTYWVPREAGLDPNRDVSIINDNRARLAKRIRQLKSGTRHSQIPPSWMRRLISNLVIDREEPSSYRVVSNFALFEMTLHSTEAINIWAGRAEHRLRRSAQGLRMYFKKVVLINGDEPLPSLAFLI